jgi:hypothetical protein
MAAMLGTQVGYFYPFVEPTFDSWNWRLALMRAALFLDLTDSHKTDQVRVVSVLSTRHDGRLRVLSGRFVWLI